jgi:DNA polymerase (family X)
MDPRTASHTLSQIADLLELRGENKFKVRAYRSAARSVLALETDDIGPLHRSGKLAAIPGIGKATLGVLTELIENGESRYLEELRTSTPEGLLDLMRVPGLATTKIQQIHETLGVETLQQLEDAARNGRLAALPRFGPKTAEKILQGIGFLRETSSLSMYPHAVNHARLLLAQVDRHPDVVRATIAGSIRRRREIVRDIDIVAACAAPPEQVAASLARMRGVRDAKGVGGKTVSIRYVDGTLLHLHCVSEPQFAVALWRATGSMEHVREMSERAASRGLTIDEDSLRDGNGRPVEVSDEVALFAALGMSYIEPELREAKGELDAASAHRLPSLIEPGHIRGVLHCHTRHSDGTASVAEMADAAKDRGWSYIGITDHSESAGYAGGLTRDRILRQHEEIDEVNELGLGIRVLKGLEADILMDGRVDYPPDIADRFDFIIGSIHSRFAMDQARMTERVLRALDDPNLSILGHPTGRLLLSRDPYPIDIDAVIEKASEVGAALELNADPKRLDLDWRLCRRAKERGVIIEIGPDAHSTRGLDVMDVGVGIGRKAWLEPQDVLNTRSADDIVSFARERRSGMASHSEERTRGA